MSLASRLKGSVVAMLWKRFEVAARPLLSEMAASIRREVLAAQFLTPLEIQREIHTPGLGATSV